MRFHGSVNSIEPCLNRRHSSLHLEAYVGGLLVRCRQDDGPTSINPTPPIQDTYSRHDCFMKRNALIRSHTVLILISKYSVLKDQTGLMWLNIVSFNASEVDGRIQDGGDLRIRSGAGTSNVWRIIFRCSDSGYPAQGEDGRKSYAVLQSLCRLVNCLPYTAWRHAGCHAGCHAGWAVPWNVGTVSHSLPSSAHRHQQYGWIRQDPSGSRRIRVPLKSIRNFWPFQCGGTRRDVCGTEPPRCC